MLTSAPIDTQHLVQWLKALAEPKRLQILNLLMDGVQCNCELGEHLDMAPNLISHHLSVLRKAGLVDVERDAEDAAAALQNDPVARCAIEAYQQREQSLRALRMLGAVSPAELQELERLRRAYVAEPSVVAYVAAQETLTHLAQASADRLTQQIGLDLIAACGGSCCG